MNAKLYWFSLLNKLIDCLRTTRLTSPTSLTHLVGGPAASHPNASSRVCGRTPTLATRSCRLTSVWTRLTAANWPPQWTSSPSGMLWIFYVFSNLLRTFYVYIFITLVTNLSSTTTSPTLVRSSPPQAILPPCTKGLWLQFKHSWLEKTKRFPQN